VEELQDFRNKAKAEIVQEKIREKEGPSRPYPIIKP